MNGFLGRFGYSAGFAGRQRKTFGKKANVLKTTYGTNNRFTFFHKKPLLPYKGVSTNITSFLSALYLKRKPDMNINKGI